LSCFCGQTHTSLATALACSERLRDPQTKGAAIGVQAPRFQPEQIAVDADTSATDSPGQRAGIYLATAEGKYKIGCSREPERRAKALRAELLDWVPITFGFDFIEARVHRQYAAKRLHGEWFGLDTADIARFSQVVHAAIRWVQGHHPLARHRLPPGRPALSPDERRRRARDRKRRERAAKKGSPT
jgi:Meiotically Up-regulated Gene 113 (MUG113) protein